VFHNPFILGPRWSPVDRGLMAALIVVSVVGVAVAGGVLFYLTQGGPLTPQFVNEDLRYEITPSIPAGAFTVFLPFPEGSPVPALLAIESGAADFSLVELPEGHALRVNGSGAVVLAGSFRGSGGVLNESYLQYEWTPIGDPVLGLRVARARNDGPGSVTFNVTYQAGSNYCLRRGSLGGDLPADGVWQVFRDQGESVCQ